MKIEATEIRRLRRRILKSNELALPKLYRFAFKLSKQLPFRVTLLNVTFFLMLLTISFESSS